MNSPNTPDRRERIARIIDPSSWRVMDSYLAETKRKYAGQDYGYDPDAFKDKASLAKADTILADDPSQALADGHEKPVAWRYKPTHTSSGRRISPAEMEADSWVYLEHDPRPHRGQEWVSSVVIEPLFASAPAAEAKSQALAEALEGACIKLRRYKETHPGTWVGGVEAEYQAVLRVADAALKTFRGEG